MKRHPQQVVTTFDGRSTKSPGPAPAGRKDDAGKDRFDMLPWSALREVARVMAFGAKKYGQGNWQHVDDAEHRYIAAAIRHLVAHLEGLAIDAESGLPSLAHASCSALFALWFHVTKRKEGTP